LVTVTVGAGGLAGAVLVLVLVLVAGRPAAGPAGFFVPVLNAKRATTTITAAVSNAAPTTTRAWLVRMSSPHRTRYLDPVRSDMRTFRDERP
jgi:hypothetical protein